MAINRIFWNKDQHEFKVERFYSAGAEKYGDFHGGYLNFGLWREGIAAYEDAAENLVKSVGDRIRLDDQSYLLDVACGMGAQEILLHKTYHCRIEALDVTWKHLQQAQKRITAAGMEDKVVVQHGTATDLPYADNSFSHLMSIEGPEHFNTREDFFAEAFRVLAPGGKIGLTDYTIRRQPKSLMEKFILEAAATAWHVPKENYDDALAYAIKLKNTGFRNISLQEIGAQVIPGYYFEQKKPETRKALRWLLAPQ